MLLFLSLLYASYTDYKNCTIRVWLFPLTLFMYILLYPVTLDHLMGLLIGIPVLVLCLTDYMGGGDLLMFLTVGYVIGISACFHYAICMSITGSIIYLLMGSRKGILPIAPLAAGAYLLFLIIV